MKTLRTLLVIAIAIVGFNSTIKAQVTETNTASAKVLSPITLTAGDELNFGSFAAKTSTGTIVLSTGGSATPTNVSLSSVDTPTAASFTVSGESGYTYSITLPGDADVTLTKSGGVAMPVTDWLAKSASGSESHSATGTLTGGSEIFKIGATLHVNASQAAGTYTSNFSVSVNYN